MADLDGDGVLDMVSGSYMPGDIFLFRGLGDGKFAPKTTLMGTDGKPARAGLASAVAIADWDKDGDLDLVVGNIKGEVWLLPRTGTKDGQPAFGVRELLCETLWAKSERMTTSIGDAGPLVGDWNGDGLDDLLVGYSDGSVRYWKSKSVEKGTRTLDAAEVLIEASKPVGEHESVKAVWNDSSRSFEPQVTRSHDRVKLALCDWNHDGKPDLLVGDFLAATGPEPELTAEQRAERGALESRQSELNRQFSGVYQRLRSRAQKELGIGDDASDEEDARLSEKVSASMAEDEESAKLRAALEEIRTKLKPLTAERSTHGYVWVYLRRAQVSAAGQR